MGKKATSSLDDLLGSKDVEKGGRRWRWVRGGKGGKREEGKL